jgi:hypothetical protein
MVKSEYISGVMQRMNELGWSDSFTESFMNSDATNVERQIDASYCDAWRKALQSLPRNYFNQQSFKDSALHYDKSRGTGFVVLPSDYYVLSFFKMKGWKQGCYTAIEEDDAVSVIQSNDYVRGNICRPVCTVSESPLYGKILNYYSLPKGRSHETEAALYIPLIRKVVDDTSDLGLDERLYAPLQWINAGLVFTVLEKPDLAKAAGEKALEML